MLRCVTWIFFPLFIQTIYYYYYYLVFGMANSFAESITAVEEFKWENPSKRTKTFCKKKEAKSETSNVETNFDSCLEGVEGT